MSGIVYVDTRSGAANSLVNAQKIDQPITNVEFPPASASNSAEYYADYTGGTVDNIDVSPPTLVEYPPIGLYSTTTTTGPITIAVSGAFYGNGNYITSASSQFSTSYSPWKAFDKGIGDVYGVYGNAAVSADSTYNTTAPYAAISGGPTTVSGVSYTGYWVQIQMPSAITVRRFMMEIRALSAQDAPSRWVLAGSTDGTTWTALHLQQSAPFSWISTLTKIFDLTTVGNYAYYRIIVTHSSSAGYAGINQLAFYADANLSTTAREYPPLPMTANTTNLVGTYGAGTYVASSSGVYTGGYIEYGAFNKTQVSGITLCQWASGPNLYYNSSGVYSGGPNFTIDATNTKYLGDWLQIKLPVMIKLSSYAIISRPDASYTVSSPTKWYIFGSIDGVIWYMIDNQTQTAPVTWASVSQTKTFNVTVNTYYNYYRILVTNTNNNSTNNDVNIGEWKLFSNDTSYPKYREVIPTTSTKYNPGTYSVYANTQYQALTIDAQPPTFIGDKLLTTPWKTGSNLYTSNANASANITPSVYFELPGAIALKSYTFTASNVATAPSAWNVYSSNLNIAGGWQLVEGRSNITNWASAGLTQTFTVNSQNYANYYRYDFLRNTSFANDFISLAELRLFGNDQTPETRLLVSSNGGVGVNATESQLNSSAALTVNGNFAVNGMVAAGNLGLFRNRIINGDMRIDQRYSGASTTTAGYVVDRWVVANTSLTTITAQRVTAPENLYGFTNALSVTVSGTPTSMSSNNTVCIYQGIEGNNTTDLMWGTKYAQPVTISFNVYTTQVGTYSVGIRNGTSPITHSYITTFTVSTANTWVRVECIIPGCTTGEWLKDTNAGLYLTITLAAGPDWQVTNTGRWIQAPYAVSGSGYISDAANVNFCSTVNNQFLITGVQLEKGTIVTPFEFRPYSIELQLCQRYYEKSYDDSTAPGTNTGFTVGTKPTTNGPVKKIAINGNDFYEPNVIFKVMKRSTNGTITIYSTDGTVNNVRNPSNANIAFTFNDSYSYAGMYHAVVTLSGMTANLPYWFHWTYNIDF